MKNNVPDLLDRLIDARHQASGGVLPRMSIEQRKDISRGARATRASPHRRNIWTSI